MKSVLANPVDFLRLGAIAAFAGVLVAGCDHPAEVTVQGVESGVDVVSLVPPDTNFGLSPIDSSALLPEDQVLYDGFFVVNNVRHDAGEGLFEFSVARAYVADRNRPVEGNGRTFGYHGFHLGQIYLNNLPMIERVHYVPEIDTLLAAGFEYTNPLLFHYMPGQTYTWSADSIGGPALSIGAPEVMTVSSPKGGSIVRSDQPLELKWTSDATVTIVVSRLVSPGHPVPMLRLFPRQNGFAVVPAKVLRLLPPDQTYFLTFIRSNRKEIRISRQMIDGNVLVQAASVYNVAITLR